MKGWWGKGGGKYERINAQFSSMPATECIGFGRLEGWFSTPAFIADGRGWGYVQSDCFEGDLFFHLQRSPWLRGINFQKKDPVTFEVVEVNGRCEAVKLLVPSQVQEMEERNLKGGEPTDPNMPGPKDFVGQRVFGNVKCHHGLVARQNWGFVTSDAFSGQVFWHLSENPDMGDVEFDREDVVEFDVCLDENRGSQVRAKNMKFIQKNEVPLIGPPPISEKKRLKKEQWLKNWSVTPPPDWDCPFCAWNNFGRNKTCNNRNAPNCPGTRPPREEWPAVKNVPASLIEESDVQARKALTQQVFGAQAWGTNAPIPPSWQQGVHLLNAGMGTVPSEPSSVPALPALPALRAPGATAEATVMMCLGTFDDLFNNPAMLPGDPNIMHRVHSLVVEVNELLGEDRQAKHSFSMLLAKMPWFGANGLEVRYQPGKNLVAVSPASQSQQWQDQGRKRRLDEQGLV